MQTRGFEQMASVAEAALLLDVHQETIRRWIRAGKIQGFWLGKQLRVKKADVAEMITPIDAYEAHGNER